MKSTVGRAICAGVLFGGLELSAITVVTAPDAAHLPPRRSSTGVPSIEVSNVNGRLWRTYYAAEFGCEGTHDYAVLATSADDGRTWRDVAIADPDANGPWRAFDPELWIDPDGRLWWTWTERNCRPPQGVKEWDTDRLMAAVFSAEDVPVAPFPEVRQIGTGIMMGKPLALRDGRWLFPNAHWFAHPSACVTETVDRGRTFREIGGVDIPDRHISYPEHQLVELKDGRLWCVFRGFVTGAGCSYSQDGGLTWGECQAFEPRNARTRICVRRLRSGNILLVKQGQIGRGCARYDLTAFLSRDEGKTWEGGLLLDARLTATYPDAAQGKDGSIYITWDCERQTSMDIRFAKVTEEEILARRRNGIETGPDAVRSVLDKYVASGELAGAVSMVFNGTNVSTQCVGNARPDSYFWIASMTKGITAAAVMTLVDAGRMKLTDPIEKFIPAFTNRKVKVVARRSGKTVEKIEDALVPISIRHCLAHCAGYPFKTVRMSREGIFCESLADRAEDVAKMTLDYQPQSAHVYSNIDIDLCARVVEIVSGMPFDEYLRKTFFLPLGMKETTFRPSREQIARLLPVTKIAKGCPFEPDACPSITNLAERIEMGPWHPNGGGGLFATAGDVFAFYRMLAADGKAPDGTRILSHDSIVRLSTAQFPWLDRYSLGLREYAYGWFGHDGALQTEALANWRENRVALLFVQLTGEWRHPFKNEWRRAAGVPER